MTTTDPQAIARETAARFEEMAEARANYADTWADIDLDDPDTFDEDATTSTSEAYEQAHAYAMTITDGTYDIGDELPFPDDIEPWPTDADVLEIKQHAERSIGIDSEWRVTETVFVTGTGGPHVEIAYNHDHDTAEVRCYWTGQGTHRIATTDAIALLRSAAESIEEAYR